MRKLILLGVVFLCAGPRLGGVGAFHPLNVKTGLWETSLTSSVSGRPPMPADLLERLTPEQRARFEATMNKMASQVPKSRTTRTCLTKEKLERNPFGEEGKSCTETVINSTGSSMEVREVCAGENMKSDVTVHIEAADSEHVKGTVKSNVSGGDNAVNVMGTFASKWLGAACGDTE